jgi:hypothetical protein
VKGSNVHAFENHIGSFKILKSQYGSEIKNLNRIGVGTSSDQLSIDDYATCNDPPSVMKIDVEGEELSVLQSARETLEYFQPELFVEIHPKNLVVKNQSVERVSEYITDFNYNIEYFSHREKSDSIECVDHPELLSEMNTTYCLHGTPRG